MQNLTPEGLRAVSELAAENGVSLDAALTLLAALAQGNGSQAQFHHPDLGGMGQWSQGGMIMIGDMFNQGLKSRVDRLCNQLATLLRDQPAELYKPPSRNGGESVSLFVAGSNGSGQWWPVELGAPASVGGQNDLRYAYFPDSRRLAILQGGRLRVYDTGDHRISGFSQQQSGDQSLTFTSQLGLVRVGDLHLLSPQDDPPRAASSQASASFEPEPGAPWPAPSVMPPAEARSTGERLSGDAILTVIERLADLRQKNILTEEEFAAKKRELLGRL